MFQAKKVDERRKAVIKAKIQPLLIKHSKSRSPLAFSKEEIKPGLREEVSFCNAERDLRTRSPEKQESEDDHAIKGSQYKASRR